MRFEPEGVTLRLRRSKMNQEGAEEVVPVVYGSDPTTCPVRTLRLWLDAAAISSGPLFRQVHKRSGFVAAHALSDRMIPRIVQRLAHAAGVEADFAGHSLRSGFATAAARAGKSEAKHHATDAAQERRRATLHPQGNALGRPRRRGHWPVNGAEAL